MANTLTNLIPSLYEALDVVSRELVGFIPAVTRDSNAERAAVGQNVYLPITPAVAAGNITPAVTPPNDGDQTIGSTAIQITKARRVPIRWNGEEVRGVDTGPGYSNIIRDQFAQAMRTLVNEMETDVATAAYQGASFAFGTAGTAPFGGGGTPSVTDAAEVLKMLIDNGCPTGDLQMVIDTAASLNLRKVANLLKANEAGTADMLRRGQLGDLFGLAIRESAGVIAHTKGTGASATVNNAGYAVGAQTLTLSSAGTGTLIPGDVVTFAGDSVKYVVKTGDADVSNGGTLVLNDPGLRLAMSTATKAITVGSNFRANMAFHRSAIVLVSRAPALPPGGDMAEDRTVVSDPVSGLSFEISVYRQYRQVQYEVAAAWGAANIKGAHSVVLLG